MDEGDFWMIPKGCAKSFYVDVVCSDTGKSSMLIFVYLTSVCFSPAMFNATEEIIFI